jgi:hypothetical protein
MAVKMNDRNVEIKKKIIQSGNSKVLKEWQKHSTVTQDEFLEAVEWVCGDPLDERNHLTREIGLEPDGIVKLDRVQNCETTAFYRVDNSRLWSGAIFKIPATTDREKLFADENGMLKQLYKISLSALDRV